MVDYAPAVWAACGSCAGLSSGRVGSLWLLYDFTLPNLFGSFIFFFFFLTPQHFPLYRKTEMHCTGVDAPPPEEKQVTNREKWEVVSKEMSSTLLSLIRPRLVLSGHTHHGCYLVHEDGTPEMTIPSFSWRNRNNPSFVLVSLLAVLTM